MRTFITVLILLAAFLVCGCRTMRGVNHHNVMRIYYETRGKTSEAPEIKVPEGEKFRVFAYMFGDEVITPTGMFMSDARDDMTETHETYFTPHLVKYLFDKAVEAMQKAGIETYRLYDRFAPGWNIVEHDEATRMLRLNVRHVELHRWDTSDEGTIDLACIEYDYRWLDRNGKTLVKRNAKQDFRIHGGKDDDLDIIARQIAAEVIDNLK